MADANKSLRCLVVAPQPFFTPRGTPFSVYYRTLVMSELGHTIDIVTYGEGKDPDIPRVRVYRGPRFRFLGPVRTGPSMLKLFLDFFVAAQTFWRLLRKRYDVVHAHEEAVFICRFLKPIFRFKLVYDMHSSLVQQLTNFDFTDSRLVHWVFRKLEDSSIRAADAVITICPDLQDYATGIIEDTGRLHLIENSIYEVVRLRGEPQDDTPPDTGDGPDHAKGRFCFVYAGTLENYQGIDVLLQAFARVVRERPDAFLLIVGGTPEQVDEYRQQADGLGLGDDCHFTGSVPQARAHTYMSRADVLLSPRIEGTNTPLKIYQQLASGIAMVATEIYSHTQVLDEEVAFLAEPEPGSFAGAMIRAMSDPAETRKRAGAAKRLYEREYSRESYVRKLSRMLDGL
ncbi:MAG: glycosyltransferase family 4 protein [Proteobacteria bacterium]|nr:glycosyltransferase family 4 protein [Pseudomonadota bacterium]